MLGGLDQQKTAQVRQIASKVNAEIQIKHQEHEIILSLVPTTPEAQRFLEGFLPQFAEGIATQLSAFFGIKGKIVHIGRKG